MTDILAECRNIALAAKLNRAEAEKLAMAAIENAGDVPADQQLAVAISTVTSYVNGDTRGADLDYLLGYCAKRSRAAAKLIRNAS